MTSQPADAPADSPSHAPADSPSHAPADSLPDAPLFAMLRSVQAEVGAERIDRIWIFPPRRLKVGETAVAVVAAYLEGDQPDRRRVLAAHYTAPAEADAPRLALHEYATAPVDRIGRVVEDVVDRLGEGPPEPARSFRIEGDPALWDRLLHELARTFLEGATANPRLRP